MSTATVDPLSLSAVRQRGDYYARTMSPITAIFLITLFRAALSYEDICRDKNYVEVCLDQLPPLISRDGLTGIPNSKKQVDAVCSAFKKGMTCIDQYSETCLPAKDKQTIDENVAGARHTFAFLCDDPLFQSEYLQYASCYRAVTKDWDSCANRFLKHVTSHNASAISDIEACCAKQSFHRCIYEFGNLRCRPDAALFLKRIAETLSNVHVYKTTCFPEEKFQEMCASSRCAATTLLPNLAFIFIMFRVVRNCLP